MKIFYINSTFIKYNIYIYIYIMTLEYVATKDQLPADSDFECSICLNNIDVDEKVDDTPNCVICINGHRTHNTCLSGSHIRECPVCRTKELRFCKSKLGYSYVARKGGKKRKTHKKRKTYKKGKTKNNRRLKYKRCKTM
jgi:hypothetical protein